MIIELPIGSIGAVFTLLTTLYVAEAIEVSE